MTICPKKTKYLGLEIGRKRLPRILPILGLLCVFFFSGIFSASAQLELPLSIKSSVSAPQPGQTITLTAETFSFNLESSILTWHIDGKEYRSGVGNTSIQIKLGSAGEAITVSVVAVGASGEAASASRTLNPAKVTLLWEAETYTPPLYKGKALFTAGSYVRFVALPTIVENGRRYTSDELLFTWKDNGQIVGDRSGLGKNVFFLKGSRFGRDMRVSVEVETPSQQSLARSIVVVPRSEPQVRLYERTPLAGIVFSRALTQSFQLESSEVTLEAYPYFFSTLGRNALHLEYDWQVGGSSVTPPSRKSAITLERGETVGIAPVALSIENIEDVLQRASAALSIQIGTIE